MNQENLISVGQLYKLLEDKISYRTLAEARVYWEQLEGSEYMQGSEVDFHNLSILFYQVDDYASALNIATKGLELFPSDKDLLADSILYLVCLGKLNEVESLYEKIYNTPKSLWTWRCFAFLIKFCLSRKDTSVSLDEALTYLDRALELTLDYQKYHPNDDRAYLQERDIRQAKIKILREKGESEKEEEEAIENALLKACNFDGLFLPNIALEYAEHLMSKHRAKHALDMCLFVYNNIHFGETVNYTRTSYLIALAQSTLVLEDIENAKDEDVLSVYTHFANVIKTVDENRNRDEAIHYCRLLAERTEIAIPEELQAYIS